MVNQCGDYYVPSSILNRENYLVLDKTFLAQEYLQKNIKILKEKDVLILIPQIVYQEVFLQNIQRPQLKRCINELETNDKLLIFHDKPSQTKYRAALILDDLTHYEKILGNKKIDLMTLDTTLIQLIKKTQEQSKQCLNVNVINNFDEGTKWFDEFNRKPVKTSKNLILEIIEKPVVQTSKNLIVETIKKMEEMPTIRKSKIDPKEDILLILGTDCILSKNLSIEDSTLTQKQLEDYFTNRQILSIVPYDLKGDICMYSALASPPFTEAGERKWDEARKFLELMPKHLGKKVFCDDKCPSSTLINDPEVHCSIEALLLLYTSKYLCTTFPNKKVVILSKECAEDKSFEKYLKERYPQVQLMANHSSLNKFLEETKESFSK